MSDQPNAGSRSFSAYLPLFLLSLALLTTTGFQTLTLVNEATQLKTAIANQDKAVEEGQQMREKLQQLASQALALANQGNENAAMLIEAMRKKGINIQASPATPPAEQ